MESLITSWWMEKSLCLLIMAFLATCRTTTVWFSPKLVLLSRMQSSNGLFHYNYCYLFLEWLQSWWRENRPRVRWMSIHLDAWLTMWFLCTVAGVITIMSVTRKYGLWNRTFGITNSSTKRWRQVFVQHSLRHFLKVCYRFTFVNITFHIFKYYPNIPSFHGLVECLHWDKV